MPLETPADAVALSGYMRRLLRRRFDHFTADAESDERRRYLPDEA